MCCILCWFDGRRQGKDCYGDKRQQKEGLNLVGFIYNHSLPRILCGGSQTCLNKLDIEWQGWPPGLQDSFVRWIIKKIILERCSFPMSDRSQCNN